MNTTSIEAIREQLLNKLLLLLAILVLPLLVLSLARYATQGWMPIMGLHVLLVGIVELIWLKRRRLPGAYKVWGIVISLSAVGAGNLLLIEAAGLFSTMTLVSCVMVGVWYGLRASLIYWALMCFLGLILAAVKLQPPFQFYIEYSSFFIFSGLIVMFFSEYSEALTQAMERANTGAHLARESEASEHAALCQLEQKNARQAEMFAIISHELRTPASAVAMMLTEADSASFHAMKPDMQTSLSHLLNVLDDMRLAVNPQVNLPLKPEDFKAEKLLEQMVSQTSHLLKEHGLQLYLNLNQADQMLHCDTRHIKMALLNLIRNSALHSGGKHIWLHYRVEIEPQKPDRVRTIWLVEDDGEGIDETLIPNMFAAFQRGPSLAEGTGLGLFIIKQTIDRLGGEIHYRRSAHGGACFEIRLSMPVARPISQAPPAPALPKHLAQLRVLLVEDDAMLRKVMELMLSQVVGALSVAVNGADALRQQELAGYDLILTDLFMPEINGIQLVQALRAASVSTPVIGITAATIGNEAQEFMRAGADAVLEKPIDLQTFNDAITQLRHGGRLRP